MVGARRGQFRRSVPRTPRRWIGTAAGAAVQNASASLVGVGSLSAEAVNTNPHVRRLDNSGSVGAVSSLTNTVPTGGVPIGDMIFAVIVHDYTTGGPTISDTRGNSWVRDRTAPDAGSGIRLSVFSCFVTTALQSGDTITATLSASIGHAYFSTEQFTGVSAPVLDKITGVTGSGTAVSINATGANATAKELAIAVVATNGSTSDTFTTDTDYTQSTPRMGAATVGTTAAISYRTESTVVTESYDATLGTSRAWVTFLASYKLALNTSTYNTEVMTDSPTIYWRLGESSGTTAVDSSGNAYDATYENGPTLGVPGLIAYSNNTAVDFDKDLLTDVRLTGASAPVFGSAITLEAWVTSLQTSIRQIIDRESVTTAQRAWQFRIEAGVVELILWNTAGTLVQANGTTAINDGSPHHVVAVYNGTDIRIYVDGVLDGTPAAQTGTIRASVADITVGIRNVSSEPWNRVIDEVAIYSTALAPERVAAHYNAGVLESQRLTQALLTGTGELLASASVDHVAAASLVGTGSLTSVAEVIRNSTVTQVVGTASAAGVVPTVTGVRSPTVTQVVGTAAAAGLAPTVTAVQSPTVTQVVGTASAVGLAPALTAGASTTQVVGTASAAGVVPSVGVSRTVTQVVGTASSAGLAPAVSAGASTTQVVGTASAAGVAPAVSAVRSPTVAQVVGTASAAGLVPTVAATRTGDAAQPAAGQASASSLAPAVSGGATVVGTTATATAQGLAPTLTATASVTQTVGTATAQGLAASITLSASVTAPTGTASAAGLAPTVTATAAVTQTVGAASAAGIAPSVSADVSRSAPAGTATSVGLAPSYTLTANLDAPAGAATAQGVAPFVSGGSASTVSPPPGTATAEGLAPTVTGQRHATVTVPAGEASAAGVAPDYTLAPTVDAPVGAAYGAGVSPSIALTADVAVPAGTATAQGTTQIITTGGSVTLSPTAGTAAAYGVGPDVAATRSATVAAPAGAATATGQAPTLSASASVTVPPGLADALGLAPDVSADTLVQNANVLAAIGLAYAAGRAPHYGPPKVYVGPTFAYVSGDGNNASHVQRNYAAVGSDPTGVVLSPSRTGSSVS